MINLQQSCRTFHQVRRLPQQNFWKTVFEIQGRQDILENPKFADYFSWQPNRSNCPDLESLLEGLIQSIPEPWKARAKKIFAGRNLYGHANAEAWRSGEVGVIEVNYGMTSAAMIYGVLYCNYMLMVSNLGSGVDFFDDDDETLLMILKEVGDAGFEPILVAEAERHKWRSGRHVFAGHELLRNLPKSVNNDSYHELVGSIEEFTLAHELSHHLLGHTEDEYPRSKQNRDHFEKILAKYELRHPAGSLNEDQRDEVQADTLALLMVTGTLTHDMTADRIYRASAGSVIGLTALAHIDDSWVTSNSAGETHPDFVTRYENAVNVISALSRGMPIDENGGHPLGCLAQLSGFVSIILDRWLSEKLEDHAPINVLGFTSWLFERGAELQGELEGLRAAKSD
ncbi:hypothetical protein ACIQ64_02905 [Streptomyces sp. NPDC094473]|uniref:hypothetical protein n=1 Tax=unclassified Streptomyces TaxID=2593676 RepID=UPI002FC5C1D9